MINFRGWHFPDDGSLGAKLYTILNDDYIYRW